MLAADDDGTNTGLAVQIGLVDHVRLACMDATTRIAAMQLSRMRGMTAMYHKRFFFDINFTTVLVIALLVIGWWQVPEAFLLVPVVALIGAVATAFDSSYLTFAALVRAVPRALPQRPVG